MTDHKLYGEQLVSLSEVPDFLPSRHGKKLHVSTVHRWVLKGARGKVLDSTLLGGVRYTSLEALERFLGMSTTELIEVRRQARIKATLAKRGLSNPRRSSFPHPGQHES